MDTVDWELWLHWYWGHLIEKSCVLLLLLAPTLMRRPGFVQYWPFPVSVFELAAATISHPSIGSSCAGWSLGGCTCDVAPGEDDYHVQCWSVVGLYRRPGDVC